jgi:DNA-binding NtrC family response regulator
LHLRDVEVLSLAEQRSLLTALRLLDPTRPETPRVVSSTSVSLDAAVAAGRFDRALAEALSGQSIEMPPLRRHIEDVPALAEYFLAFHNRRLDKRLTASADALTALRSYDWPGNVGELASLIERASALADPDTELDREDFILRLEDRPPPVRAQSAAPTESVYDEIEREEGSRLRAVLKEARGNKARAARVLGVPRTTLNDWLRKYNVE